MPPTRPCPPEAIGSPQTLFSIDDPFEPFAGTVRLLEPPESDWQLLRRRLRDHTYDKPFILDHERERRLHFSLRFTQSLMSLDDPYRLSVAYTRKMMAFLLFRHAPRNVLLIGLGGGSLAKACFRHLPLTRIQVVEICPYVLALRRHFMVPADDERFEVIAGDGRQFLGCCPAGHYDVIAVDAFDECGLAPSVDHVEFYARARRALAPGGIFVMNFAGEEARRERSIATMRAVFGPAVLSMSVPEDDNDVVYAFADAAFEPRWPALAIRAEALKSRLGIDFPRYAVRLQRDARSRQRVKEGQRRGR